MADSPDVVGIEAFIAARGGHLHRAAWFLTGDPQHAEDLLQAALVKCWHRFGSLAGEGEFEAYLRTTMYRTFVSWWRRRSWRSEFPTDLHGRDPGGTPTDDAGDAELRLDLFRALATLPRQQRAVLVLRFLEDRSVADVAETLGISEGAVKQHTHRGCRALRGSPHLAIEEVPT